MKPEWPSESRGQYCGRAGRPRGEHRRSELRGLRGCARRANDGSSVGGATQTPTLGSADGRWTLATPNGLKSSTRAMRRGTSSGARRLASICSGLHRSAPGSQKARAPSHGAKRPDHRWPGIAGRLDWPVVEAARAGFHNVVLSRATRTLRMVPPWRSSCSLCRCPCPGPPSRKQFGWGTCC